MSNPTEVKANWLKFSCLHELSVSIKILHENSPETEEELEQIKQKYNAFPQKTEPTLNELFAIEEWYLSMEENPTQTTYDLNTKELIEAAKGLLDVIEHINKSSMKDVTLAWGRLNKAVITMECQEKPEKGAQL